MKRPFHQPRPLSAAALKRTRNHPAVTPHLLSQHALRELVAQMID